MAGHMSIPNILPRISPMTARPPPVERWPRGSSPLRRPVSRHLSATSLWLSSPPRPAAVFRRNSPRHTCSPLPCRRLACPTTHCHARTSVEVLEHQLHPNSRNRLTNAVLHPACMPPPFIIQDHGGFSECERACSFWSDPCQEETRKL